MLHIPARGRQVTDEPLTVAPELLGAPLASFRRRATAFVIDLVLFGLVVGGVFLGLSLRSIDRDDPTLLSRLGQATTGAAGADSVGRKALALDLFRLVVDRAPGTLPADVEDAVTAGDVAALDAAMQESDLTLTMGSGRTSLDRGGENWVLTLGPDVLLGEYSSFFSWGAFFVGWFTILSRLGRGRSPGKALLGIRIARLDGRPLSWWNALGRAGGYSASAATALLGFLEMIWDPNRQTLHDKIAATVVLDHRRWRRSRRQDGG